MTMLTTTKKVFEFLRWNTRVPSHKDASEGTTLESVDTSGTLIPSSVLYLDNPKIIDGTLILTSGTAITATQTTLTKNTDYSVELDEGKITILSTAKLASKSLFAKYQYNTIIEDSVVSDVIQRQSDWINDATQQTFGTTYLVEKEEYQGKGQWSRLYRPKHLPIKLYKSQLAGNITTAVTVIPVNSTEGLNVSDIISINKEKLQVTAVLSSTAFQALRGYDGTSAIASHSQDDWLTNLVVEVSNAEIGYEPTWNQSKFRSDFDADSNTGAIQLLHVDSEDLRNLSVDVFPPNRIFNRIRITYRYGRTDLPPDIEGLAIRATSRELIDMAMSKALSDGANSFNPQTIENLDKSIEKILKEHRLLLTEGY